MTREGVETPVPTHPDGEDRRRDAGTPTLHEVAERAGLRRVRMVAWRDLDDPEAGGSELHAHRIAEQWASAGLEVTLRTSEVHGQDHHSTRSGYRTIRRGGRYRVFPQVAWEGLRDGHRPGEGLVEVWNGMPFFSPLWYRGPRVVFLHHVHAEMWRMVLPGLLGRAGQSLERYVAPWLYRSSRIVTLSTSSRDEIISMLQIPPSHVSVVPPGVEDRYARQGQPVERSERPLVVAVGRLVPVKRFDLLMTALAKVRAECPGLRAVIVGEGYERQRLEALRRDLDAEDWLELPGRVGDDEVVEWYRRAWVVASASLREGWGMTLTEAAACGTPAVATRIAGHMDAVVHGRTGLLAEDVGELAAGMSGLLRDAEVREEMGRAARRHAGTFTWEATARATLETLADEARHSASNR